MIITTGILLVDGNKFLVGHVTGSRGTLHNNWSIPKGQVDNENDDYHENAYRELFEECNIPTKDLLENANYINFDEEIYPNGKKKVICFIYELHTPIDHIEIKCNSIVPKLNYPEFDAHKWITFHSPEFEELHPSQKEIITRYFIKED